MRERGAMVERGYEKEREMGTTATEMAAEMAEMAAELAEMAGPI